MKVSGFTFVRNGEKYGYPFIESIQSLLPLCDEVIIAVGKSEDRTLKSILDLNNPKIRIIETEWDETLRTGGAILAQQTDIALAEVSGDWAIYLQADEILHEKDYSAIRKAMHRYHDQESVEGLLFSYKHFYGSYSYVGTSRQWYRREVRIVRPRAHPRSWGDAQGFRIDQRKMSVKLIDATIYHYGWVKPPEVQQLKQKYFNKLWHEDQWVEAHVADTYEYDYSKGGTLSLFHGTHPQVMNALVQQQQWTFHYDPLKVHRTIKDTMLEWIENQTGYRIGEYKNYTIV